MKDNPIPLYLVSGFLGSGKSSFLKGILDRLGRRYKIAIVQNEFAAVNIDRQILEESAEPHVTMEVNNGSVFCLCLLGNFIPQFAEFLEREKPDIVFIEATGLADPLALMQVLTSAELRERVIFRKAITVVNAARFTEQSRMLRQVVNQVRVADMLILNRCDTAAPENIDASERAVRLINANCSFIRTTFAELSDSEIDIIMEPEKYEPALFGTGETNREPLSAPPKIDCSVITEAVQVSSAAAERVSGLLKNAMRAKGYIRTVEGGFQLNAVEGEVILQKSELPLPRTELVIFGNPEIGESVKEILKNGRAL